MMTLIERLEGLTGPCRECDALIYADAFAPEGVTVEQSKFNGEWCVYLGGRIWEPRGKPAQGQRYTASIDAAMTLVPEGCMWNVGGNPKGGFASAGLFGAAIWQGIDQIHGEAPTPAIALCIAALKAVQS